MSDGITDAYRDQQRGEKFEDYIIALIDYLVDPTEERRKFVIEEAGHCDGVGRGYFSSRTNLAKDVEESMAKLRANDKNEWIRILYRAEDCSAHVGYQKYKMGLRDKLKSLSPFAGKLVVMVKYGSGFVHLEGDAQQMFDKHIKAKGLCTYDCDTYAVVMEEPKIEEVIWRGCRSYYPTGKDPYSTPNAAERQKLKQERR